MSIPSPPLAGGGRADVVGLQQTQPGYTLRTLCLPFISGEAVRQTLTLASGFERPIAVVVDPLGALLVADYGRGMIFRIQARGNR